MTVMETAHFGASEAKVRRQQRRYQVAKRSLDVGASAVGLLVLSPLLIVVAAVIRLTSRGPALYVQTRIGRGGTPFRIYKFRSMYNDAEQRRAALIAKSDRSGVCFKQKNDPRVTPVGRFIRKYSIDELPQLFNVLIGDMSLVGPRPALPEEVEEYPKRALGRLKALPGITGIWQVSGRAEISFENMVEKDLDYIKRANIILDIKLLIATFGTVLTARGSY